METENKPVLARDWRWEEEIDYKRIKGIFWMVEIFCILMHWWLGMHLYCTHLSISQLYTYKR